MVLAFLTALTLAQATGSYADGPVAYSDTSMAATVGGTAFTALPLNTTQIMDGIKVKGFRWVELTLVYTYNAATAVNMTCEQSEDNATWAYIQTLNFTTPPTASSASMVWSKAVSGSGNWIWSIPNKGVYFRCRFSGAGAAASDLLTLKIRAGV